MDVRARSIARYVDANVTLIHRMGGKVAAIAKISHQLAQARPQVTVVFDIAFSGVLAALGQRVRGNKLVIDTGDAIFALGRSLGRRPAGLAATLALEQTTLRCADAVVVRGTKHRELLARQGIDATVIQDGVDVDDFAPNPSSSPAARNEEVNVGVIGSSVWVDKLGITYGWELVEALPYLEDIPVVGTVIGDGTGISRLQSRARALGVVDRLRFIGRVPYSEVPRYLAMLDVCLSTQTNDDVGQVRTTGKLPLYMAAGKFILSTDVGEASLVLPKEMLVRYDGVVDRDYPRRLAERIRTIVADRTLLSLGEANVAIAREKFDYSVLGERYRRLLDGLLSS